MRVVASQIATGLKGGHRQHASACQQQQPTVPWFRVPSRQLRWACDSGSCCSEGVLARTALHAAAACSVLSEVPFCRRRLRARAQGNEAAVASSNGECQSFASFTDNQRFA